MASSAVSSSLEPPKLTWRDAIIIITFTLQFLLAAMAYGRLDANVDDVKNDLQFIKQQLIQKGLK